MLLFLVTPCPVVAVQPCMEWIPIRKKAFPTLSNFSVFFCFVSNTFSAIVVQFKVHTMLLLEYFNFTEKHLELCETCMMEHFCENDKHPKEIIYFCKIALSYIVCIGVSTPFQKHHSRPSFLPGSPLKSANCPSPPFKATSPYILVFRYLPPP